MTDNISKLNNCYGCGVCVSSCPVKIISLQRNEDGFYTPVIKEQKKCIGCGICLKICAFNHKEISIAPEVSLSAGGWSKDRAVRMDCSSGGIGFEIGRKLLKDGYKVVTVRYNADKAMAEHFITQSVEEFRASMGSKYIPSFTADALLNINFKQKYFFAGTPCQIDSMRRLIQLRKAEENFILLDFFCHGVPSLLLWDKYIKEIKTEQEKICDVKWRDKHTGWHDSWAMKIGLHPVADNCATTTDKGKKHVYSSRMSQGDLFYNLFLGNYCLNHCCYKACKYKRLSSAADIRIGDFWGKTYADNNEGVSTAIAFTERGKYVLNNLTERCIFEERSPRECCEGQIRHAPQMPFIRRRLLKQLKTSRSLEQIRSGLISAYRLTLLHKRIYYKLKERLERRR